ncbi:sodium-coupled monocarboxylate transporter 1 isoform X3 [Cherax quadricarinatus]|uniref:sodium-coupled monocarboxylate transporter 1 isoform X3 n=1 Tax=Cherax quadricarinatus TaxID=27406 RepID=UPI00387E6B0B
MEGSEEPPVTEGVLSSTFTPVDYVIFTMLLVISAGIGVFNAFRSRGMVTTQEYLLGGRTMPVLPVAISVLGGVVSAVSLLGFPTEVYFYGTQLTLNLIGTIFGILVLRNVMLPVLFPLQLVSMFEYIELRFKSQALRKIATVIQMLASFVYMGIGLYAPSLALSSVTSLPIWGSVVLMGLICSFYITIGGVKAVVYADVVQTLLMFVGVLVVTVLCCYQLGGLTNVWTIAEQGGRIQFFNMDPSPFVRHTFWSTQVLGAYMALSMVGFNQPQFQRLVSVKTLSLSQSSLSSHGNAIACVIWVDFMKNLRYFSNVDERFSTNIVKLLSFVTMMVAMCIGLLVGEMGTLFNLTNSLIGAIKGPLSGIFIVGICTPWVNKKGAIVGSSLAFLFNIWLVIGKIIRGGGSPKNMPLSTLGCPENFNNTLETSLNDVLQSGLNNTLDFTFATTAVPMIEGSGDTIYDISYCYSGITGIINTIIISTLVSVLTGPVKPCELEGEVVNGTCARFYRRLWKLVERCTSSEPPSVTPAAMEGQINDLYDLQDNDLKQSIESKSDMRPKDTGNATCEEKNSGGKQ